MNTYADNYIQSIQNCGTTTPIIKEIQSNIYGARTGKGTR